ncbi:MAG TPA: DUF1735 domain-containing protein [Puia sp.]|nr:DUF1735 domain-containing protein [Puia sp.]
MNVRKIKIAFLAFCVFFLGSCLKDTGPVQDYSQTPALVGFQFKGGSAVPIVLPLLPLAGDSYDLEVTLSVPSVVLGKTVNVTVIADQDALAAYDPTLEMLPADQYTIPNGGVVTIPAGKQIVPLSLKFDGTKIDFSKNNALAFRITDAQGLVIASNLNIAILKIVLKSEFEGNYTTDGKLTRFAGSTEGSGQVDQFDITGDVYFNTVTANSIDAALNIPGFSTVQMTLVINADNSVTITKSVLNPGVNIGNNPGKPSTYDPVTKSFDIHGQYLNAANALREVDFTMVLH